MTCWETVSIYAFRSLGYGERLLPRSDFTLCQQFTLIGSGMLWNIYFGVLALCAGFILATAIAVGKASGNRIIRKLSECLPDLQPADLRRLGRADRAVPQHRRLLGRDLLRRTAIHPERRHRGS